jgi:hypothetical protein
MLIVITEKFKDLEMYPNPNTINCDFEKAVINVIKLTFGDDIQIQCCFYHLCKSTQQQGEKLELETYYTEYEMFSTFYVILDGIAYLPVNDIEKDNYYAYNYKIIICTILLIYFYFYSGLFYLKDN